MRRSITLVFEKAQFTRLSEKWCVLEKAHFKDEKKCPFMTRKRIFSRIIDQKFACNDSVKQHSCSSNKQTFT